MSKEWYAEDSNYFGTSSRAAETWLEMAKKELMLVGGKDIRKAAVEENDTAVYVIEFTLDGDTYRMSYPAMPCKKATSQNLKKAKVQAATFLYHAIKARALDMKILGAKAAFGSFMLVDGLRTVSDVLTGTPSAALPILLNPPKRMASEVVEGIVLND